ncbi:unnamed protein product [Arabidopsis lyrata]|uniref:Uncharacterized protein n=2 Tax=Arabidopsis TaxID=3701 RepID=A0A8T2BAZ5_ARASU|nr:hypothetical protein ISN45_Aa03g026350 [Arabidopsis thaliana x Arabidopsis arenosa]KAG7583146.1 hypothetical protein ISN44_As08g026770 [Arabidopsis suecica]CAH8261607.1 unnamed protein product [Arabidopsis lyrata]
MVLSTCKKPNYGDSSQLVNKTTVPFRTIELGNGLLAKGSTLDPQIYKINKSDIRIGCIPINNVEGEFVILKMSLKMKI